MKESSLTLSSLESPLDSDSSFKTLVGVLFDFFLDPDPILTMSKVLTRVEVKFFVGVTDEVTFEVCWLLNRATFSEVSPEFLTRELELKWLTGEFKLRSLCSVNKELGKGLPLKSFRVKILGVL